MQDDNSLARELMQTLGSIKKGAFHKDRNIGVFQGELAVLHCIYFEYNEQEEITPSSISSRLNVARPTVTAALNNLEKKGYIARTVSKQDRRRMQVKITPEGRKFIEDKHEMIHKHINMIITGLGEENSKELIRLLGLCLNIIQANAPNRQEQL